MGFSKACYHHKVGQEVSMVKLTGMTVEGLMHLRKRVDEALHERRTEIEKQLKMFAVVCSARVVRGGGGSPMSLIASQLRVIANARPS